MTVRKRIAVWLSFIGLLLTVLAATPARGEEPSLKKQISEIEKQIAELQKQLDDLRRQETTTPAPAGPAETLPAAWVKKLNWRCLGPATMGGRIVALAVYEADPVTYWVATASGGLLKTTNNGTTFEHQFDHENTVSIGDVALAPSNKDIVWVGTGENNPRNSVSYGDGVYKSTDGGKTWKHMGLKKSFQIGRIAIHPTNPDIVYVGALGRLYGPGGERGLYKTSDGGKTWDRVLPVDERTGIIEVRMSPADPKTLLVAAWERQRDGFDSHPGSEPIKDGYDGYDPSKKWGPGSGIYRTSNGGKTWDRIKAGLPACDLGRIGLDFCRKDPKIVYAIIDSAKIGMGTPPTQTFLGTKGDDADNGAELTHITPDSPAAKAGLLPGDIVKAIAKKPVKTYDQLIAQVRGHKNGDKVSLTVLRGKETKEIAVVLGERPLGQGDQRSGVYVGVFGRDTKEGLRVTQVALSSPAAKAGLKADDVIKAVDKKPLKSLQQLRRLTRGRKPGDKLTLTIQRDKESREVVLVLETRPGIQVPKRPWGIFLSGQNENIQDKQGPGGHDYGGVYRSEDAGLTWKRVNSLNPRPMYFSHIRVDPSDDKRVYVTGIALYRSEDGGKTFKPDGGNGVHADQHALWIDPKDGRHMLVGSDGGFYATYDRMQHWDYLNTTAIGQFYHVVVDTRRPYRVYGGMQDNGSWGGPSHSLSGGILNDDWVLIGGGDGFVCGVDPDDPDIVYGESQDGSMYRRNLRTGTFASVRPQSERGRGGYRFNWNTPFILSRHNPHLFYSAGNYVFRSLKQGQNAKPISPEITRTKRGSGTALAESPLNPDVLWAGTDDGNLWLTRDGGKEWTNVADKLIAANVGLKGPRWVASIEASRVEQGRAYVVLDGHRSDDDEPHVYVTEDFGEKWRSLRANLPWGSTRVLREDVDNPRLLYLGTEFAVWASINRGESWTKINNNLPTVAVHEIAVHPTAGEIVAATHGRSLWALDVSAVRQIMPSTLEAKAHLFRPQAAVRWRSEPSRGSPFGSGSRRFIGQNPPRGAQIYYVLGKKADKITLKIVDFTGKVVRELKVPGEAGLHQVSWDLTRLSLRVFGEQRVPFGELSAPGMYRVVLSVDGTELAQSLRVDADPTAPPAIITEEQREADKEEKKPTRIDD